MKTTHILAKESVQITLLILVHVTQNVMFLGTSNITYTTRLFSSMSTGVILLNSREMLRPISKISTLQHWPSSNSSNNCSKSTPNSSSQVRGKKGVSDFVVLSLRTHRFCVRTLSSFFKRPYLRQPKSRKEGSNVFDMADLDHSFSQRHIFK